MSPSLADVTGLLAIPKSNRVNVGRAELVCTTPERSEVVLTLAFKNTDAEVAGFGLLFVHAVIF